MVGIHGSGGLNTRQVFTLPNGHICAVDIVQKVAKSMDSITRQSSGELQPGDFSLTATRAN